MAVLAALPAGAQAAARGSLSQPPDPLACLSADGTDQGGGSAARCTDGRALSGATDVAVSADGRSVYVASAGTLADGASRPLGDGLAVLRRSRRKGTLSQLAGPGGCISNDGADGATGGVVCKTARALDQPASVAVSPDSRHVYVASAAGISTFIRKRKTGALKQRKGRSACLTASGAGGCATGRLVGPGDLTISRDGRSVYLAGSRGVAVLSRNRRKGSLKQLKRKRGCLSERGAGGCAAPRGLDQVGALVVSRDGRHAYAASTHMNVSDNVGGGAVVAFARSRKSGALRQLKGARGCLFEPNEEEPDEEELEGEDGNEVLGPDSGFGSGCGSGRGLVLATAVAISRDGRGVYIGSSSDGLTRFVRSRKTGGLRQRGSPLLEVVDELAFSPDSRTLYALSTDGEFGRVDVLSRSRKTGRLRPLKGAAGCLSSNGGALPDDAPGPCGDGRGVDQVTGIALSADGRGAYLSSAGDPDGGGGALAVLKRKR